MFLMPFICFVNILLSLINKNIKEEPKLSVETKPYERWYLELGERKKDHSGWIQILDRE